MDHLFLACQISRPSTRDRDVKALSPGQLIQRWSFERDISLYAQLWNETL